MQGSVLAPIFGIIALIVSRFRRSTSKRSEETRFEGRQDQDLCSPRKKILNLDRRIDFGRLNDVQKGGTYFVVVIIH